MSNLRRRAAELGLAIFRRRQKTSFFRLRSRFPQAYEHLLRYDVGSWVTPAWRAFNKELEEAFLPYPDFGFLNNPTIQTTMFTTSGGSWLTEELRCLENRFSRRQLFRYLREDYVGKPKIMVPEYFASHNSVHHLYHLARFAEAGGADLDTIQTTVEWGGGYGNLVKILRRVQQNPSTIVIIDTPLLSCVQWLYLSSVLGEDRVALALRPDDKIERGKINLVPICLLNSFEIRANLFISTWALSESSESSIAYVASEKWFGATHLLLAYHGASESFPHSHCVGDMARQAGAGIEEIGFLPGHYYCFK